MEIVKQFEDLIKTYTLQNFDKVYEKINDSYKLIYSIQGLNVNNFYYSNFKIIFWINKEKTNLSENVITYLYSQNCDYKSINIKDLTIEQLFELILTSIKTEKTNKEITQFIIGGTDLFNKVIKQNEIQDFIQELVYKPTEITSCVLFKFLFVLKTNNAEYEFTLKANKENWTLEIEDYKENLIIEDVYKKVVEHIYGII